MREVLKAKLPNSLDHSAKPPTPIAATVLDLTVKAVMAAAYSKNTGFRFV